jgi:hypothetical protein
MVPTRPATFFAPRPTEIGRTMWLANDELAAMVTQHPTPWAIVADAGVARVHRLFMDWLDDAHLVSHSTARRSAQRNRSARRWQQQSEHPSRSNLHRHHPAHVTTTSSALETYQQQPLWQHRRGTTYLHQKACRSTGGPAVCPGSTDPLAPKCPATPPC